MPNNKSVTRQVTFVREYTFTAEADLAKMHLAADPGLLATMQPKMSDYNLSLKSVDSVEVGDTGQNNARPMLTVLATVVGTEQHIAQWLDEIDKRHTVHTEMSDSEQLRAFHKARKAAQISGNLIEARCSSNE